MKQFQDLESIQTQELRIYQRIKKLTWALSQTNLTVRQITMFLMSLTKAIKAIL